MGGVKHTKVSSKADCADTTLVRPSDWNAEHLIEGTAAASFPAAGTAGRFYRRTDGIRGLWLDTGTVWTNIIGGYVNVKDFGALGDGVTDDTAAVAAARAAAVAAGAPLMFEAGGTYPIDQLAGWSDGVVLAFGATILHNGASKPLVTVDGNAVASINRFRWFGGKLKAKQSSTNPTTALLYLDTTTEGYYAFEDMQGGDATNTNRYATYGIWLDGSDGANHGVYYNTVSGFNVHGCADSGVHITSVDGANVNRANANVFINMVVQYNDKYGIDLVGGVGNVFHGGAIEGNYEANVSIRSAYTQVIFFGTYVENKYELLTLDVAPGGTGWAVGDTVTGLTSGVTCTVRKVVTTLTYYVQGRSGAFTLGEILTNGTNQADQGAANPTAVGVDIGSSVAANASFAGQSLGLFSFLSHGAPSAQTLAYFRDSNVNGTGAGSYHYTASTWRNNVQNFERAADSENAIAVRVTGDAGNGLVLLNSTSGGYIGFGDRTNNTDVALYRGGANLLTCDGKLTAAQGLGVGNSAAGDVTATAKTKKIQVFDADGVSLGYLQVYAGA